MGVVVRRYYRVPHNITYPCSTCIRPFLQQHPYFFVHFKNVFHSCLLFLYNIANVAPRTFEIIQNQDHVDMAI